MTDVELILQALHRLPVPEALKEASSERREEFVERILHAGLDAGIRPAPTGSRGSPTEIIAAANDVARGLDLIERGLNLVDGARRSTADGATLRASELRNVHEAMLRSVAAAIASALPTAIIRDVDIDASTPTYSPSGFSSPWRGVFSRAAGQVERIAANASTEDLRAPKPRDEWFGRLVRILAEIYQDATGKIARPYARGQAVKSNWEPPFCKFVRDLWPIWAAGAAAPSDGKIRDAFRHTSKLLPEIRA